MERRRDGETDNKTKVQGERAIGRQRKRVIQRDKQTLFILTFCVFQLS